MREGKQHLVLLEVIHETNRLAAEVAQDLGDFIARLHALVADAYGRFFIATSPGVWCGSLFGLPIGAVPQIGLALAL
jgi:hypothetical protein